MREPFPFESNGLLLSKFLVPDPVPRREWEKAEADWQKQARGKSLIESILDDGLLTEEAYLLAMAQGLGKAVVTGEAAMRVEAKIPEAHLLRQFGFIVLAPAGGKKRVAGGPDLPPQLGRYLGNKSKEWQWVLIPPHRAHTTLETAPHSHSVPPVSLEETSSPARWLEQLLQTCQARDISDLHLERGPTCVRVRMRTASGMRTLGSWPPSIALPAIRLLKEWSGTPTAECPLPSDRRLYRAIGNQRLAFRMSHLPTVDGESLVLRQMATQTALKSADELGVPMALQTALDETIRLDSGIILFTGPTGSGKTTTLYATLSSVSDSGKKIMTIEDPVEYELPGAIQSQVDLLNGWSFDRAVRAFLRQDPDILVLGEMRDKVSAEAACRAALTGHTVLATLHAICPTSALDRLHGWGLSRNLINEIVHLVVNQRLESRAGNRTIRSARFSWAKAPFIWNGSDEDGSGLPTGKLP